MVLTETRAKDNSCWGGEYQRPLVGTFFLLSTNLFPHKSHTFLDLYFLVPVGQPKSEQVKFAAALMSRVRQKYSSYAYVVQPNAIDLLVSLDHSRSYLHLLLIFSQKTKMKRLTLFLLTLTETAELLTCKDVSSNFFSLTYRGLSRMDYEHN